MVLATNDFYGWYIMFITNEACKRFTDNLRKMERSERTIEKYNLKNVRNIVEIRQETENHHWNNICYARRETD